VKFEDQVFGLLEMDTGNIGDFILLRSDGSAQYNFACVVDDSAMGITDVIRGEGHISNTYRQLLVYESLGLEPPRFAHLSTILGPDGEKLSKRHGATSIDEFRRLGYLPHAVLNYLALLGWAPPEDLNEILELTELVRHFDLKRVNRGPATFDLAKLNWINRGCMKRMDIPTLSAMGEEWLIRDGLIPRKPSEEIRGWVRELIAALLNYVDRLADVGREAKFVFHFNPEKDLASAELKEILLKEKTAEVISAFGDQLNSLVGPVSADDYRQVVRRIQESTGVKGRELFHPLRVAVTARASGPELEGLIPLLEKGSRLALVGKIMGVRERVEKVRSILSRPPYCK
jgi:glutamyl-tRNA synthetase